MTNGSNLIAVLGLVVATAACGFEHERNVLAPTATPATTNAPAPTPSPAGGASTSANLLGLWTSNTSPAASLPDPNTCGNFQFQVTNQTPTTASGTFSGTCGNGLSFSGTASGQLNGTTVRIDLTGSATGIPGIPRCDFTLTANGNVEDNGYSLPLSFTGTTCLGPVHGHETLRRPAAPAPQPTPTPAPAPTPPPPPPAPSTHVGPGPSSEARAKQVVFATAEEFPHLTAVFGSEGEAVDAADQLLQRTIWHLQLAGYQAGRQKNPSGAISSDKLTVLIDGAWHAYDIFSLGYAGRATTVIFLEVWPANHVPSGGIPD